MYVYDDSKHDYMRVETSSKEEAIVTLVGLGAGGKALS